MRHLLTQRWQAAGVNPRNENSLKVVAVDANADILELVKSNAFVLTDLERHLGEQDDCTHAAHPLEPRWFKQLFEPLQAAPEAWKVLFKREPMWEHLLKDDVLGIKHGNGMELFGLSPWGKQHLPKVATMHSTLQNYVKQPQFPKRPQHLYMLSNTAYFLKDDTEWLHWLKDTQAAHPNRRVAFVMGSGEYHHLSQNVALRNQLKANGMSLFTPNGLEKLGYSFEANQRRQACLELASDKRLGRGFTWGTDRCFPANKELLGLINPRVWAGVQ